MSIQLHQGDCLDVFQTLRDASIDSIVSDPPYGLSFMGARWDYDVPSAELWREALRVLKPGGHLLSFGGTRTYHRMVCAIEDAGFEVRDQISWLYGTGFPKSHDVSKALDKHLGAQRTKRRIPASEVANLKARQLTSPYILAAQERGYHELDDDTPATPEAGQWAGWGTGLKPSQEPICLARKPFRGTVAANVLQHGTGALNIDACRVPAERPTGWGGGPAGGITWDDTNCGLAKSGDARPVLGRWPANTIHDGSPEVLEAFPNDSARFFYCAKPSTRERQGSRHPTVKPVALMRYLVRLVTPPGGTVLDPFAGSGTTGVAAVLEGFSAVLIEREAEYVRDIQRRLGPGGLVDA